jgi:hypothetical protein
MFYDSVRITGLKISSAINIRLIKLHASPNDAELKAEVIRTVICLCWNSMLLKQNDKHLNANIHHISYSIHHFIDVLELNSLKADFEYALAYMQGLKQQVYPGLPINCANFSIE